MAKADVETVDDFTVGITAGPTKAPETAKAVSFSHTQHCADTAVQLLLLRTIMKRCCDAPGLSPELVQSMQHYACVLDGLLDAATLLSHKTSTPDEARQKLRLAADRQALAGEQFGTAVAILQDAGKGYGLDSRTSDRHADLDRIRLKYATTGCRVQTPPGG